MYELALFAGAGGGILGGILCGHTCIGAVEIEEYPREVLLQRQRDGILPRFGVWDDICTFRSDNPECSEYFDFLRSIAGELVISGGFPCQDISAAGKGEGITGSRSGLWGEMARIVGEIRPARVFVENSPLLVSRGLTTVLGDLAEMGYDARWCVLGADNVGAPHIRKRIWIVGNSCLHGQPSTQERKSIDERSHRSKTGENKTSQSERSSTARINEALANANGKNRSATQRLPNAEADRGNQFSRSGKMANSQGSDGTRILQEQSRESGTCFEGMQTGRCSISWWVQDPADISNPRRKHGEQRNSAGMEGCAEERTDCAVYNKPGSARQREHRSTQPFMGRVAPRMADTVDRLKAIGNGQVPAVVELAWKILRGTL